MAGLALAAVAATVLVTATAIPAAAQGEILYAGSPTAIAGSYIVVFDDAAASAQGVDGLTASLAARANAKVDFEYRHALRGFAGSMSERAARRLAADPAVAYVSANRTVSVAATQPNPPSWGLDRIDQRDRPLNSSYTYPNTASNVTAYIIDTGIRISHQDFGGRAVWGTNTTGDGNNSDCNGHGTHVAGTVGGTAYGVAKGVRLVAVKVLNCSGSGTFAGVAAGVDWVTGNHGPGAPAVANMSLGGQGSDAATENAVRNSIADGVVYAIASGNSNSDACNFTPARVAEAITVNASDINDARASFSNWGTCTDIFGPGVNITSAWSTSDTATNTISGTSMATPHIAGGAALILGANPGLTPAQVWSTMSANASLNKISNPGTGSPNRLLFVDTGGTPPSALDVYALAKQNTGSGTTEAHVLNGGDGFQSFLAHRATALHQTGTDSRWLLRLGDYNRDGVQDVYAIVRQATGSGRTEVHVLNGADGFQSFLAHIATALHQTGSDDSWTMQLGDYNRDSVLDLYAIFKQGTASDRTEVHVLNGADGFQSFLARIATALHQTGSDGNWTMQLGDYNRDGVLDVYAIVKQATGSGRTEVHVLDGATGFQSFLANIATALGQTGSDHAWVMQLGDYNGDTALDVYAIAKQGTASGRTEVHVLNGANGFQSFLGHHATALGQTGSDHSWELLVGNYG